jgi:L-threonylcarbamoyladenylate synthase
MTQAATACFDLDADSASAVAARLAELLRAGAVGIVPTETVYGLIGPVTDAARLRICALKARSVEQPLQLLVSDVSQLAAVGVVPSTALDRLAAAFWPGPLTVVAPSQDGTTVGVRIPDHPFALQLLRDYGSAVLATSANRSGMSPAASAEAGFSDLCGPVDFVVHGEVPGAAASTVLRLEATGMTVLRAGPIPAAALADAAGLAVTAAEDH